MAARAIFKGTLRAGSIELPVKLYSAVEDRGIHFHLLHEKDGVRVAQRMVSSATGEEVPREEIQKGYEVEPGVYVLLADEDLATLDPKASDEIEVEAFVPAGTLARQWYERPYYLGPDGAAGPYFALAQALRDSGAEGLARWTMRKKRYAGALRTEGEHLVLITVRASEEVISADDLEPPGREPDAKELAMAGQLVAALEGDFDPAAYADEYRERVLDLVKTKAAGRRPKVRTFKPKAAPTSLASALEASIRNARTKARAPLLTRRTFRSGRRRRDRAATPRRGRVRSGRA